MFHAIRRAPRQYNQYGQRSRWSLMTYLYLGVRSLISMVRNLRWQQDILGALCWNTICCVGLQYQQVEIVLITRISKSACPRCVCLLTSTVFVFWPTAYRSSSTSLHNRWSACFAPIHAVPNSMQLNAFLCRGEWNFRPASWSNIVTRQMWVRLAQSIIWGWSVTGFFRQYHLCSNKWVGLGCKCDSGWWAPQLQYLPRRFDLIELSCKLSWSPGYMPCIWDPTGSS